MGAETTYTTARFLTPDYLVQAQSNVIRCPLWASNALVAPTQAGSTVSVYDPENTAVVNAAAVTVTASIAQYTIASGTLPTSLQLRMGWRIEWTLIVAGVTTVYRNSAGLIRSRLAPVVADADLYRRVSALNPTVTAPLSSLTSYQDFLDEAWVTILARLALKGSLPHLIMEPSNLREVHLLLTLAGIFEDFSTRLSEAFGMQAKEYRARYERAWGELAFEYDADDDGQSDGRKKRSANPTVWLCGRG